MITSRAEPLVGNRETASLDTGEDSQYAIVLDADLLLDQNLSIFL